MSWFPRWLIAAGVGVFLLGAGLYAGLRTPLDLPPPLPERSQMKQAEVHDPFPSVEFLSGPWVRRPPASSLPAPPPATTPAHVDSSSLLFLGSYCGQDGIQSFFFKFVPTGRILILKQGQTESGWSLRACSATSFSLTGPGCRYEVAR